MFLPSRLSSAQKNNIRYLFGNFICDALFLPGYCYKLIDVHNLINTIWSGLMFIRDLIDILITGKMYLLKFSTIAAVL